MTTSPVCIPSRTARVMPVVSQNTREAHPPAVGRYVHRSAESRRYTPADTHAPRRDSLRGRVGRRGWWNRPGHKTSRSVVDVQLGLYARSLTEIQAGQMLFPGSKALGSPG